MNGICKKPVILILLLILCISSAHAFADEWSYPVSKETLEDAWDVLLLVNKDHLIDTDYPPQDALHELVNVEVRCTSSSVIQARSIASNALSLMFEAAKEDGIVLYLHSGYRSYRTQDVMHYNRVKSIGYDDGVVQQAGASDHQTGLGFDIISKKWIGSKLNEKFAQTEEAQWMADNCYRFGFIIRYPKGKEDITGIIYEPWHLRFVGIEAATYIMEHGLTLEEFTEEYRLVLQESGNVPDSENPEMQTTSEIIVF